ncbi:MAG: TIGR00268 family protein, partial [Clostridiales bacterium]|nr:TIGR00268 family protein [Clostridiales bacterium]
YICKKNMLQRLLSLPELDGMAVFDGSNTDDALDYRPGEKALLELGVRSPLREAGLSKEDVRAAARALGLSVWDKPAFACLASRIPYGERITTGKLASIYALEKLLQENGLGQVRVRHHGDVARIEVLPDDRKKFFDTDFMDKINEAAKGAGFVYAALDLGGYKMGNMNMSTKNV